MKLTTRLLVCLLSNLFVYHVSVCAKNDKSEFDGKKFGYDIKVVAGFRAASNIADY